MIKQQAGTGLGIVPDAGNSWSGGATRSDGEANRTKRITENRPKVFFDMELDKKPLGRIVFELFGDIVPKTADNFRCLCTGERGISPINRKAMHYKGTHFHRIVNGSACQGGDFETDKGKGGHSIYNLDKDGLFGDESFRSKHNKPGLLSMINKGPNTAGSQFLISAKAHPSWDGKYVVFGEVIKGLDILMKVESMGSATGVPKFPCRIVDCGELESAAMKRRRESGGVSVATTFSAKDQDKSVKEKEAIDCFEGGEAKRAKVQVDSGDGTELPLAPGWKKKESRSTPGMFYYFHDETKVTQFKRPVAEVNKELLAMFHMASDVNSSVDDGAKKGRDAAKGSDKDKEFNRAIIPGKEIRIIHIMKKHKDFYGKPATSNRKKEITISKEQAKEELTKLAFKLHCTSVGGGVEGLRRKFANYALAESDCDLTAKRGGDLGPKSRRDLHKKGWEEFGKLAWTIEIGDVSQVIQTSDGFHILARIE